VCFAVIASGVVLAGCGASHHSGPPNLLTGAAAQDPVLRRGSVVFNVYCAGCHGPVGQGDVGPAFTGGRLLHDFKTASAQEAFVARGKGVMPAWGPLLSKYDLDAVVRYEREILSPRPAP
jgi:mono/diheme cytochrome c family protein